MVGGATGMDTTTTTSVLTPATGDAALTTQQDAVTPTVSITDRGPQDAVSTLGLLWPAQAGAPEDLVAEGSEAAVVFMEAVGSEAEASTVAEAEAFTEVAGEATVGER